MDIKINGINNTVEILRGKEKDELFIDKLIETKAKYLNDVKMVYIAENEPNKNIQDTCRRIGIEIKAAERVDDKKQVPLFDELNMYL